MTKRLVAFEQGLNTYIPGRLGQALTEFNHFPRNPIRGDTMQRTILSRMILGLLLFCCNGFLLASEGDELRERSKALRKKVSVSAEQGNKEQAERLEQEAVELLEAAERQGAKAKGREEKRNRPSIDKELRRLKQLLQDLLVKERELKEQAGSEQKLTGVREQIAGTELELKQFHAHHAELLPEFREQEEKLEVANRRIHHLRVAAQNLKLAEEHDLAHKLMGKVDAMERDVQEAKKRLAAELHGAHEHQDEHGPDVVRELKEEIQRLRAEVKELSQKFEKR